MLLLVRIALVLWGLLSFNMNFKVMVSVSVENLHRDFWFGWHRTYRLLWVKLPFPQYWSFWSMCIAVFSSSCVFIHFSFPCFKDFIVDSLPFMPILCGPWGSYIMKHNVSRPSGQWALWQPHMGTLCLWVQVEPVDNLLWPTPCCILVLTS